MGHDQTIPLLTLGRPIDRRLLVLGEAALFTPRRLK